MNRIQKLQSIRRLLLLFMIALFISGLTAIPVDTQLSIALKSVDNSSAAYQWIQKVLIAYRDVNNNYPFLFYGYDWLAFAHFVLAVLFIGPYKNPVRNIWVIQFGLIACVLVLPFAFVAGYYRDIPVAWRVVDCSFGIFGFLLLWIIYTKTRSIIHN